MFFLGDDRVLDSDIFDMILLSFCVGTSDPILGKKSGVFTIQRFLQGAY
jgi:hypothetical protein